MTRLCVLSVLVVKMPVPSITVRRVAKQHDKMLTTENTADTKFLNRGITQTIIAAADLREQETKAAPFGVGLLTNFSVASV